MGFLVFKICQFVEKLVLKVNYPRYYYKIKD